MTDDWRPGDERLDQMRERFRGALLGVAIGDALGAPIEGGPMRDPAELAAWVDQPPKPLRYTDDTDMTLATAGSLVTCRGFDGEQMADALASRYEREPWRGYGSGPPQVFRRMREGKKWNEAADELFDGAGSYGNGAAMRSTPIGLLYFLHSERAVEVARLAARITHAHPLGEDGAVLQAAAVAEFVQARDLDPAEVLARLRQRVRTNWFRERLERIGVLEGAPVEAVVRELGNGVEAHRSVPTAVHAFLRHRHSFPEAVLYALSLGGDADTIASMTGALAGAFLGASAIPSTWSAAIEGRDEILQLADQLLELASAADLDRDRAGRA